MSEQYDLFGFIFFGCFFGLGCLEFCDTGCQEGIIPLKKLADVGVVVALAVEVGEDFGEILAQLGVTSDGHGVDRLTRGLGV